MADEKELTPEEVASLAGRILRERSSRTLSPEEAAEMGSKGGAASFAKRGREAYAAMGRKGGNTSAHKQTGRDPEYFQTVGRKGGAAGAGKRKKRRS